MAMQTKQLLLSLICYSMTLPLYSDEGEDSSSGPKNTKPAHVVRVDNPPTKKNLVNADGSLVTPKQPPVEPKRNSNSNSNSVSIPTPVLASSEDPAERLAQEEVESECDLSHPSSFRLSVTHREANGIGYNDGYSSIDGFFAFSSIRNWHPFFDVRTHIFNSGRVAANAGFGIRYQPDTLHALFGINGFFDFRHTHHSTFEQAGVGLEALGSKWEARANGYFPIINKNNLYDVSFTGFSGNNAFFSVDRELAFKGADVSIGRTLFRRQYFSLSSTLGGYMFFAKYNMSAKGGLFKLKTDLSRYFSIEGQVSYDTLFKDIYQGQVALHLPFGKKVKARTKGLSCETRIALADRITENVDRFEIIVTDKHNTQTVALDPRTGDALSIVFVDNSKSGGNGTAEDPYSTLQAAQFGSQPGQMIYVYSGTGTATGMNAGITLQNRQWLQGSGRSFAALTSYGYDTVPAQTSSWPTITNLGGVVVTLADDNVVQGFNMLASTYSIYGSHIRNFQGLHNNLAGGSLFDFWFDEVSGTIDLENNKSYSNNGLALTTSQNVTLNLQDNFFSNTGDRNLSLNFISTSDSVASIGFNTFQRSDLGSVIATQNNARLSLNLDGNKFYDIQDTADYALRLSASNVSTLIAVVQNNISTSPTLTGFDFQTNNSATSFLYVNGNTATYSGSEVSAYPFNFAVTSAATSNLQLESNTATSSGFELSNASTSTFNVQSPTLSLEGLESLNTGSFTLSGTGSITFISYDPSVPDLE